jgi:hypothetical protein
MRRLLTNFIFFLTFTVINHGAVAACIGFMPEPNDSDPETSAVKHALGQSDAVFVGSVTSQDYVPVSRERDSKEMLVITMSTSTWWKGEDIRTVRLKTPNYKYPNGTSSSEAHEYHFKVGATYLIYANAFQDGLGTSVCSRTRRIENATNDLVILNVLKSG